MEEIRPGKYRHYKGGEYRVLGVARNTETLEELVVYQQLYEAKDFPQSEAGVEGHELERGRLDDRAKATSPLWARPKKMFFEKIVVEGVEKPRFEFLG